MKICFTGDVFLGGDLNKKSCKKIIYANAFRNADVRVINLEQAISDNNIEIDKGTLFTGSYALNQLKDLKINAVNTAHNHIQDKGHKGITETVELLNSRNIANFGAGKNIEKASKPYWLTKDIAIFGYCDFNKPYLNQIVVADQKNPGVNPLRIKKIKSDLDKIPNGKKVILYFHWGVEHISLPPIEDVNLAKKLLEDDRVLTIIGMHSHRIQGSISHAGKKAYMSLGNFIFPNFYIEPRIKLFNPSAEEKSKVKHTTRNYHSVSRLTYKKWKQFNRISIIIEFCTDTQSTKYFFVKQDDNSPNVYDLKGSMLLFYKIWFFILSNIIKTPSTIYKTIWSCHYWYAKTKLRIQIEFFSIKQNGLSSFINRVKRYARLAKR